ncbi:hypothetical protein AMECASPLE_013689 [Ameca splendens]|uniref:B30.2/SPRY domain-containing protein n=1 Tax=Ameca splendens TaxID=208324 RepID=A0ABV0XEI4_9TELE
MRSSSCSLMMYLQWEGCNEDMLLTDLIRVEPAGVRWLKPGLRKYSCQLTIDTNTISRELQLSEDNRKVTRVKELQSYPDHPDRFDGCPQLLCSDGLTGRCYWEVEWRGEVRVSVSSRRIQRKGNVDDIVFGRNDQSWSLDCADIRRYSVWHNKTGTSMSSSSSSCSSSPNTLRVAVYVDCPAGTLSFYKVSSDSLIHLHTFNTSSTQILYPGFAFRAVHPSTTRGSEDSRLEGKGSCSCICMFWLDKLVPENLHEVSLGVLRALNVFWVVTS